MNGKKYLLDELVEVIVDVTRNDIAHIILFTVTLFNSQVVLLIDEIDEIEPYNKQFIII